MADFKSILATVEKHITLDDVERSVLLSLLESRSVKSGEYLEKGGVPTQHFIFVSMGCLMSYHTDEKGGEHVMQFATSTWWTGDLHSLAKQTPSIYSTRALVDSEVLLLTIKGLESLLERVPKFEKYFRILFQNALVAQGRRIMETNSFTAEAHYESFRERYPTLEQFVPQKYIASYLGVTPEFLSKIRRRLMSK